MVTAGHTVLLDLQRLTAEARGLANAAEQSARAVRDRVETLTRDRLRTLQELAATQLPELSAATAGAAMPELAAELQQFEQQRQRRAQQLQDELADHERATALASQQLAETTTRLDAVVAHRDQLERDAAAALAKDPAYPALAEQATQAEVCLARDSERAKELAAEAKQKLPPYEQSRLFQYLWNCKFGTAEYTARGLTARLDRWVADYIGYRKAEPSYRFLKTTPELVQLEVKRRGEEVAALRQRLEAMEQAAEAEVGVPAIAVEVDRLVAARDQLVGSIDTMRQKVVGVHAAMRDEAGARGAFHQQALERLLAFLARAETASLERRARQTPDPRDDQLVAELRTCTEALQRAAAEAPPLEQQAQRRDAIADELENLLLLFRRADFDAGRSEFVDVDLDRMRGEIVSGALPATDVWQLLRSRQRFREPPVVHHSHRTTNVLQGIGLALQVASVIADVAGAASRSSSRSSSSSSSGSSRGRSGGGFGTGGSFGGGGGGFSTGRSFGGGSSGGGGGFSTGRSF